MSLCEPQKARRIATALATAAVGALVALMINVIFNIEANGRLVLNELNDHEAHIERMAAELAMLRTKIAVMEGAYPEGPR